MHTFGRGRCYGGVMRRQHPNGRYTAAFKRKVLDWLEEDLTRTVVDAGREFGLTPKAVGKWAKKAGQAVISSREKTAREGPPRARPLPKSRSGRPHVDTMEAEEKERLVSTVKDLSTTVELGASMMADHLRKVQAWTKEKADAQDPEEYPVALFRLDRDTCGALLSLAKTASQLVDTYPGLMAAAGVKEQKEEGEATLDRVRAALGLKG